MSEDVLSGADDVGYMSLNLADWVKSQIIKGKYPEKGPEGYSIRYYRDDTFTISHSDVVVICKYEPIDQPMPKGYA